jgi:hypothetical protein
MRQSSSTAVLLTTYPLAVPRHGGQIRSAQIAKALGSLGLTVVTIGCVDARAYSAGYLGPNDIFFPDDTPYRQFAGQRVDCLNDYFSGLYAAGDADAYRRILAALPPRIDFIFLEQPWLLPVARRIRADRAIGTLIYSSQNDETALKLLALKVAHPSLSGALSQAVNELERSACAEAGLILAASEHDKATLSRYTDNKIMVVSNGVESWQASVEDCARWSKNLLFGLERFAVYVASAHPPNYLSFFDVFDDRFGFLAPDQAICIVGGASGHIKRLLAGRRHEELSRLRLRFLGQVDAPDLSAIRQLAHVFVLPILDGSGSNLKTAEALYSGAWVVGTPVSFRGFERFTTAPHVMVAQPGQEFRAAVRRAMASRRPALSEADRRSLEGLTWQHALRPMTDEIARMMTAVRAGEGEVMTAEMLR